MVRKNGGKSKDPVLVVVQLTGGNDFMNTLVPYTSGMYYDAVEDGAHHRGPRSEAE